MYISALFENIHELWVVWEEAVLDSFVDRHFRYVNDAFSEVAEKTRFSERKVTGRDADSCTFS